MGANSFADSYQELSCGLTTDPCVVVFGASKGGEEASSPVSKDADGDAWVLDDFV
jgi:hypothetical protein